MLFGEKSNESIQQLISEAKTYLDLQKDYIRLEMTEKLTILLSTLILVLIMVVLGMVALFYFSFTLAYVLAPFVGGLMVSKPNGKCSCQDIPKRKRERERRSNR